MNRPSRRLLRLVVLLAVASLLVSACAGPDTLTLTATFDDVVDLTEQAPVLTADVPVGTVTDIALTDDNQAAVTLAVRSDTGLPANDHVRAVLVQTSLLGERAVELVPRGTPVGRLASGPITDTAVRTDLEDLTAAGNDLLAFVAADRLNAAVHAGAITVGGRGGTLGSVVDDLESVVGAYDAQKGEVTRLLDNLDGLLTTLGRESETNAAAVEALARSTTALREEDERLIDALTQLRELAGTGERILRTNRARLERFFAQLEVITNAVTGIDGALQGLLTWLPRHNLHVPNANEREFVQIWLDVITCGTEAEQRDNPAASCDPPNPGRVNDPPPGTQPSDACDKHGEGCPEGHRTRNHPNDFGGDDSAPAGSTKDGR